MWKSINIIELDGLLKKYLDKNRLKSSKDRNKTFSEFVEENGDVDTTGSIGVVTKGDFEDNFEKEFIEENFEDLASVWFTGLDGQVDYGINLECMEDDWIGDKYKEWLKKKRLNSE